MNAEIEALIAKGRRSLDVARRLHDDGDHDVAVSRAYYAMFYLAQALLLERGVAAAKHSGVLAEINRLFVKTGTLPARHASALRKAFDERNEADYGFEPQFPGPRAEAVLVAARAFLDDAEAYLRRPAAPDRLSLDGQDEQFGSHATR